MSNFSLNERIKNLALGLNVGDSRRTVCPFCTAEHELSFSITREPAGLIYNCFRAGCTKGHGIVGDTFSLHQPSNVFVPKYVKYPLIELDSKNARYYLSNYGLDDQDVKKQGIKLFKDDEGKEGLYLPIYNARGAKIGETLKWLTQKKKLLLKHVQEPMFHFPIGHVPAKDNALVLVEDIISSIKVNKIRQCAALNGVNFTPEMILFCKRYLGIQKIIIFLDGDARRKMFKIGSDCTGLFDIAYVFIPVGDDPKDVPYEDLKRLLL